MAKGEAARDKALAADDTAAPPHAAHRDQDAGGGGLLAKVGAAQKGSKTGWECAACRRGAARRAGSSRAASPLTQAAHLASSLVGGFSEELGVSVEKEGVGEGGGGREGGRGGRWGSVHARACDVRAAQPLRASLASLAAAGRRRAWTPWRLRCRPTTSRSATSRSATRRTRDLLTR